MKGKAIIWFSLLSLLSLDAFSKSGVKIYNQQEKIQISYVGVQFTNIINGQTNLVLTNELGWASNPFETKTQIYINHIGFNSLLDTLEVGEEKDIEISPLVVPLGDIVITAQYAPSSADSAVHKIKIIDKKKLEALGAVNLRDALTNETNIRIAQDNVLGSSASVQGLSGQNLKILIDGVPVIGRLGGNIDLTQINVNNIERIEIIEGPLSVEYGTNALAGTINLITKKKLKEKIQLDLSSYYETVGQYNVDMAIRAQIKKLTITASGGRNYFDGWNPSDPVIDNVRNYKADSSRHNLWKPKEQTFGRLGLFLNYKDWETNLSSDLLREQVNNKGLPRAPYNETAFDDYYLTQRLSNTLNIRRSIKEQAAINVIFAWNYYERHKNTYFTDLTTLNKNLSTNASDQDTATYHLLMSRGTFSTTKKNAKLNFNVGYDINVETGTGGRIKDQEQTIGDYAGFISAEYEIIDQLILRPGIRYSYNTSYKTPVTPSFHLKRDWKSYQIRGSYSRGFRAPSIKDLYFDFVDINHNITGNPNLIAESSNNFSASIKKSWRKKKRRYEWSVDGFYNQVTNLITLAQNEDSAYTYINLENYRTFGAVLGVECTIKPFKISAATSLIARYNALSENLSVDPYSYSPEYRGSIGYEIKKAKLNITLFYKYSGKVIAYYIGEEEKVEQSLIGDFHNMDLTVSKGFLNNTILWTIGGKNLFNVTSIAARGETGIHGSGASTAPMSWGRTAFTSLKINLNRNMFKKKEK